MIEQAGVADADLQEQEERLGLYSWLDGARAEPPETVLGPGVTMADYLIHLRRPALAPAGSRYISQVPYCTAGPAGRDLRLYLYARENSCERRPGIVLIHGGGWNAMSPFLMVRYAVDLAAAGFVTAMVEYRLADEALWPAQLQDCVGAVGWLRRNHARIGLDPDRIGVAGNSAGGHLAAMVALGAGQLLAGADGVGGAIGAAVLVYPAIDILHPSTSEDVRTLFARVVGSQDENVIRKANPPTYLSAGCPPLLTLTGELDELTPLPSIRDFHDSLERLGVRNELVVYPGRPHGFELLPWEWPTVRGRVIEFFRRHLTTPPQIDVAASPTAH
ncbi:MAG: alpha/beta hydrolase [Candidatus Dormibacteria bacterium]